MNSNEPGSLSGRVLADRYLVGERLGRGGYGTVYAALQRDLQRPVAIKVLEGHVSDQDLARFEREARSAAALGHPNIVQVTDFSKRPGEPPFLVMEMLQGETLGSLLKRSGRIPAPRLTWIAQQVLTALDVAHRAGITHRDVKPDNIFLVANASTPDFVKLLDFGIAKLGGDATALTRSGAMLGSPAYMAPEQVRSQNVDPRTDIYSLGATMYHALIGRYPFDADTVHALLYAITESSPAPLLAVDASIDPRIVAVVERAMHKDPMMRFQSAAEMRAALEGNQALTQAPPPPPPAKSNAGVVIGLVVGLLFLFLVGGGIGAFLYFRPEPSAATKAPIALSASVAPSVSVSVTASATAVVAKKASTPPPTPTPTAAKTAFAGTNPRYSSGLYRKPYKSDIVRPSFDATLPAIKACFASTELDAPDHRNTSWAITADASGVITNAKRTSTKEPHPKLDPCVEAAFRTMKLPPQATGGSFEISLWAPTKEDLQ